MKWIISLLATVATLTLADTAFGQIQNRQPGASPTTRPTVSPYVLLGGVRRTPALNYFGIVRQQQSLRSSLRTLGERVTYDEAQTAATGEAATGTAAPGTALPATGHVTSFQNLSHYYAAPPAGTGSVWSGGTSVRSRRH